MYSPQLHREIARERHSDMLSHAEHERLVALALRRAPRRSRPLLSLAGYIVRARLAFSPIRPASA